MSINCMNGSILPGFSPNSNLRTKQLKMPLRRSVESLESLALNKLELVIETVILRSAEYISEHYYRDKIR